MARTTLEYCGPSINSSCGYCKGTRGVTGEPGGVALGKGASMSFENQYSHPHTVLPSLGTCSSGHSPAQKRNFFGQNIGKTYGLTFSPHDTIWNWWIEGGEGLWAHVLTPRHYMELVDRGWRRSGSYLYKPTNSTTCCPQYTIRLDVNKFVLSRSQKRVLRQMNEFLKTGKKPRCAAKDADHEKDSTATESRVQPKKNAVKPETTHEVQEKKTKLDRPVLKKKEIRAARFLTKCQDKGWDVEERRAERRRKEEARRRTIESYTTEARDDWKHKLEVKLVDVNSDEFEERSKESFELYKKYQKIVHKDTDNRFANYRNFLCKSPLTSDWDTTEKVKLGSYHMWYLLDGKLIAVGVVDILSRCFSAAYMYYDPDYSFLGMGTYTALREIEQTRKLAALNPEICHYYMGFYIDSCPKMRYKAKFRPSDLLCDKAFDWVAFDDCRQLLDSSTSPNGYTAFLTDNEDRRSTSTNFDNFHVWTQLEDDPHPVITTYSQFLHSHPDFKQTEDFGEKLKLTSETLGTKLRDVVIYFKELNDES